ncbi:DUF1427 family protein [Mangrovibacter yixingensis]|uniref:DUF1427 family protein n=1 Tax=Mangrovibacter yixingensis TaxID=1529639 RepID=UPI001CF9C87C|nr:DUF1427 family protein [Mangrovibacter yixingensis]
MENLWALLVGLIMGGSFAFLKLPIPAPQNLPGILGAFGVFIGAVLVQHFR